MKLATRCIHAGQAPDPLTGAVVTPIYLTTTYHQERLGEHKGYEYSRTGNPTRAALEANVAALEGGQAGFAFASGMAAIDAVLRLAGPGAHVLVSQDVYGGTYRLFEQVCRPMGQRFEWVDTTRVEALIEAIEPETAMVFVETPTNPTMRLTDIAAVAELCRSRGIRLVVDNTFATPYIQRPLDLGADLVVHSATKYLNGHCDVVGGVAVAARSEDADRLAFLQNAAGGILSAFDSYMVLRGIKTLSVRMAAHCANAAALAEMLAERLGAAAVMYPGLPTHDQAELAGRQMAAPGGMISVDLGSREGALAFLGKLRIFRLAESLGGVESLVCHPLTMTHASVPPERRRTLGITEGLVRLSVGIEDLEDLREDLARALGES